MRRGDDPAGVRHASLVLPRWFLQQAPKVSLRDRGKLLPVGCLPFRDPKAP
jgi:hypothetical protein